MRVPTFQNESEAITYHVDLYYERVGEDPLVRLDIDKHIALIERVNERYIKSLTHQHSGEDEPAYDMEKYRGSFIECVEYLTGVYAKRDKRDALSSDKASFRERNAKRSRFQ